MAGAQLFGEEPRLIGFRELRHATNQRSAINHVTDSRARAYIQNVRNIIMGGL